MSIDCYFYRAGRLAWLYVTGEWPKAKVDHRDLDKANNRFDNLREATHGQNAMNTARRSDNKSGFKGVCWHKAMKRWHAQIAVDGKRFNLGFFSTIDLAAEAYRAAALRLHKEFART